MQETDDSKSKWWLVRRNIESSFRKNLPCFAILDLQTPQEWRLAVFTWRRFCALGVSPRSGPTETNGLWKNGSLPKNRHDIDFVFSISEANPQLHTEELRKSNNTYPATSRTYNFHLFKIWMIVELVRGWIQQILSLHPFAKLQKTLWLTFDNTHFISYGIHWSIILIPWFEFFVVVQLVKVSYQKFLKTK